LGRADRRPNRPNFPLFLARLCFRPRHGLVRSAEAQNTFYTRPDPAQHLVWAEKCSAQAHMIPTQSRDHVRHFVEHDSSRSAIRGGGFKEKK
jgi:hypothetical protein